MPNLFFDTEGEYIIEHVSYKINDKIFTHIETGVQFVKIDLNRLKYEKHKQETNQREKE
jgi:hypothetical protein